MGVRVSGVGVVRVGVVDSEGVFAISGWKDGQLFDMEEAVSSEPSLLKPALLSMSLLS